MNFSKKNFNYRLKVHKKNHYFLLIFYCILSRVENERIENLNFLVLRVAIFKNSFYLKFDLASY